MVKVRCKDISTGNIYQLEIVSADTLFINNVLKSIEISINTEDDIAFIGELSYMFGQSTEISIEKKDWQDFLYSASRVYEDLEEYEKCQMVLSLIKRI